MTALAGEASGLRQVLLVPAQIRERPVALARCWRRLLISKVAVADQARR